MSSERAQSVSATARPVNTNDFKALTRSHELVVWTVRKLLLVKALRLADGARMTLTNPEGIMIWAIIIAGTYVAGIYVIRLVWWQE